MALQATAFARAGFRETGAIDHDCFNFLFGALADDAGHRSRRDLNRHTIDVVCDR